jgi:hypothetical protein
LDTQTIPNNVRVVGSLTAGSMVLPSGCVGDAQVSASKLSATSLQQQPPQVRHFGKHTDDAAAARMVIHQVYGATGTVVAFGAGSTVAATSTGTATVTLRLNGSAILSASIVLDVGNTAFVVEAGTLSSTALVVGDVLEAEITAVSGSAVPKGVFVRLIVREDAAP